jgi:two-component system, OmpR family, sensor histidine kinase SenX3
LQTRPVDELKRKEFYRVMLDDSDRLLTTIEQVLRTGRVGSSSRLLDVSPIGLNTLISECMTRASGLYHLSAEELKYDSAGEVVVSGDADELRAAVSNLVDNAIKYSGAEVRVEIKTVTLEAKYVEVRVRDHGLGIPKNELRRIFKRFYRVPGALSTRVKGTGLGLYIVRSVAKRHGGRAWAESEGSGLGSTFVLQLPLRR